MPSTPPTSTPPTRPSTTTPTPTTTTPTYPEDPADPRWRYFTADRTRYTSAWFAGAHRVMIGFGCTTAPYYAHDPRCPGKQGFHHGIDVVMPCGTPLTSAVDGVVAPASGPGKPDGAYGAYAFRIRVATAGVDILIGHVRTVDVRPGQPSRVASASRCPPTRARRTVATCTSRCDRPRAVWPPPATRCPCSGCTLSAEVRSFRALSRGLPGGLGGGFGRMSG